MNDKTKLQNAFRDFGENFNWTVLTDSQSFDNELQKELTSEHKYYGVKAQALARCQSNDDVLFHLADDCYAIIHLTYANEKTGEYPMFIVFHSLDDAIEHMKSIFENEFS